MDPPPKAPSPMEDVDVDPEAWRQEPSNLFVEAASKRRKNELHHYKQIRKMGGDKRVLRKLEQDYKFTPEELAD